MTRPLTDDQMWDAVAARRPGPFLLGVVTTGVFCRPGCPARTPKRENVRFFREAREAAAAGFRPCLKCRPLGLEPRVDLAARAARAVREAPERRWSGTELGDATGAAPRTVRRAFEEALGLTPAAFRDAVRLGRYKAALRDGDSATVAGLEAGYGSEAQRHGGTRALGMGARAYARGGAGERIAHVAVPTPLGVMLLAATLKGVCFLRLGDEAEPMLAALRAEFPAAEHHAAPSGEAAHGFAEAVLAFLSGHAPRPDLPLDLRGTAFEMRVWSALREIPAGQTPTYADLAATIGAPKAARAVGGANARNKVAVLVPCHLVVARNGLGGYAFGLERKQRLLELEAREGQDR